MAWRLRAAVVTLLLFSVGCVQFTPPFLMGTKYERAELLWSQGLILEANEVALMVGEKDPEYEKSRKLLEKIKVLTLEVAKEHMELGEDYEKAGIAPKAIKEYRTSLKFNPENLLVKGKLKRLEEGVGVVGPVTTLEEMRKAKKRIMKAKKKRINKRRKELEKIEQIDPEVSANIHYMRGKIYLESMAYSEAIIEFKAVNEQLPVFLDTKVLLERAVKGLELQVDRHFNKGISYFQKEEMELAVEEWSSVLRLNPEHEDAKEYKKRAEQIIERIKSIKERQDKQAM